MGEIDYTHLLQALGDIVKVLKEIRDAIQREQADRDVRDKARAQTR